jgi:anti-sigma factor RsiW
MTNFDDRLSALFYRRSCPAAEELGDYHLGRLPAGQRVVIARHLRDCPHCARELALYAAPEPEASMTPVSVLAGLVQRVFWATPATLAAPALRGAEPAPQLYTSPELRVTLEVQAALSGYRRRRLVGMAEPAGGVIGVELWQQAELLDSLLADETGFFAFDRLRPGAYTLCVRQNGDEVWLEVIVTPAA